MNKIPKVTICLLTWNGQDYLPFQIKSLTEQTFQDWQLLVLDNASTDNSVAVINEYFPPAKVIRQKVNIGFAKANNLLLKWSDSKYVLFLNQDVILEPDYLEKTVAFLDQNLNVATVSGKLLHWDFAALAKTKIIDSFGLKIDRKRAVKDIDQGKQDYQLKDMEVFGLSGALLLARREALETIKIPKATDDFEYFDEDFFAYKEDVDLAWRLRQSGWENWLLTSTKAYHHRTIGAKNSQKTERQKRGFVNRLSYRNHLATLYKNSFAKNIWKDFFPIIWYELKKFTYFLILERKTLSGLFEFFKLKKRFKKKRQFIVSHRKIKAEDIYHWFN
ncbi:glycosyltransferase family 2 protein [Candidatus Nomurabacteria bacterium]|nr:glycosyltransferase family 2 protein [Candidatus Nomurabacteria bacterium]